MDSQYSVIFLGILLFINVISVQTGDTFTVQEMLPLAVKLLSKNGTGVVTKISDPDILSKDLFKKFFHTLNNTVVVEDIDIPGLNALQALALSGVHTGINPGVITPEKDENNQFTAKIKTHCQYLLLNKTATEDDAVPEIVIPSQLPDYMPTCHYWVYACTQPSYIETCTLYASCDQSDIETGIHEEHDKEYRESLKDFRRSIGVTLIDEEVQKILKMQDLKRMTRFLDIQESLGKKEPNVRVQ